MSRNPMKRLFSILIALVILMGTLSIGAGAANSTNLNAFPESYRPMIARLMQQYPEWVFVPMDTGLDFSEAVKAQADGERSLVESGVSAWFKSKSKGCYDPSTGKFVSKDAGWVAANPAAVAYFMDPRNLLTEKLVFQFECLSYNDGVHTEQGTEKALAGTFMANAPLTTTTGASYNVDENYGLKPESVINEEKRSFLVNDDTYLCDGCWRYFTVFNESSEGLHCPHCHALLISFYGSWGSTETSSGNPGGQSLTYAQVIMNAARAYSISPYYLASKIVTEIGTTRSGSVTGTNSTYPGIYNFYNIGAFSGETPILNGLAWASTGGSYLRPWDTEEKSILGGAEYIAEKYIAKGQDTIYFQRFNVSPNSAYANHTHQYMTSTYSASTEGRKTHQAYSGMGALSDPKVFYIPVYKNLPDKNAVLSLGGTGTSTGVTNSSAVLRNDPDVNSGSIRTIPQGATVTILRGTVTNAEYGANNFLRFPYWYQVTCTVGGVNYSGYLCADFVTPNATVTIVPGESYKLSYSVSGTNSAETVYFESSDYNVASVNASGVVTAKGEGVCTVYAYTGGGSMASIKVSVGRQQTPPSNEPPVTGGSGDYSSDIFNAFTDVKGHWAENDIRYVVYHKLFNGTDILTFSPEGSMTRGMYVTVLGRLAGIDTSLYTPGSTYGTVNTEASRMRTGPSTSFDIVTEKKLGTRVVILGSENDWYYVYDGNNYGYIRSDLLGKVAYSDLFFDVDNTQYYAPYIRWAVENGIVQGYGDGTFGPNDPITREQMAIIVYNYAARLGMISGSPDLSALGAFSDRGDIHDWAEKQVAWAVANGLVSGREGGSTYMPVTYATRAEVASIMAKFMMRFVE